MQSQTTGKRLKQHGFVAQLDRAPDYGSGGLGFESLRDHKKSFKQMFEALLLYRRFNISIRKTTSKYHKQTLQLHPLQQLEKRFLQKSYLLIKPI